MRAPSQRRRRRRIAAERVPARCNGLQRRCHVIGRGRLPRLNHPEASRRRRPRAARAGKLPRTALSIVGFFHHGLGISTRECTHCRLCLKRSVPANLRSFRPTHGSDQALTAASCMRDPHRSDAHHLFSPLCHFPTSISRYFCCQSILALSRYKLA